MINKLTKSNQTFLFNRIKITTKGKNILQDLQKQNYLQSQKTKPQFKHSNFLSLQSDSIQKNIKNISNPLKSTIKTIFPSSQDLNLLSKKAKKAHHRWVKNQAEINALISKQMERKEAQNYKQYNWEKVSLNYKEKKTGIISNWNYSREEQKKRVKQRLREISYQKYGNRDKNNKTQTKIRKFQKNKCVKFQLKNYSDPIQI